MCLHYTKYFWLESEQSGGSRPRDPAAWLVVAAVRSKVVGQIFYYESDEADECLLFLPKT